MTMTQSKEPVTPVTVRSVLQNISSLSNDLIYMQASLERLSKTWIDALNSAARTIGHSAQGFAQVHIRRTHEGGSP